MKRQLRRTPSVELVHETYPELPLDVWQEIFGYLDFRDLFQCGRICRSFDRDMLHKSLVTFKLPFCYDKRKEFNISKEKLVNIQWIDNCDIHFTEKMLCSYPHLKTLEMSYMYGMCNIKFHRLTRLETLYLRGSYDESQHAPSSVSCLTNLVHLEAMHYAGLGDNTFKSLTNLTHLSISVYSGITANGLLPLKSLKYLRFDALESFTDIVEWQLPESLESLSLIDVNAGSSMSNLTNLTALTTYNADLKALSLHGMTNLTVIETISSRGFNMDDEILTRLSGLTTLKVDSSLSITNEGLSKMTNLCDLEFYSKNKEEEIVITSASFTNLVNLTSLSIIGEFEADDNDLSCLTNLESLRLFNKHSYKYEHFVTPVQGKRKKIEY